MIEDARFKYNSSTGIDYLTSSVFAKPNKNSNYRHFFKFLCSLKRVKIPIRVNKAKLLREKLSLNLFPFPKQFWLHKF